MNRQCLYSICDRGNIIVPTYFRPLDKSRKSRIPETTFNEEFLSNFENLFKISIFRSPTEPLVTVHEHSHWLWSVRYNTFHDQLILSAGSDCRVQLHSQVSSIKVRFNSSSNYKECKRKNLSIKSET